MNTCRFCGKQHSSSDMVRYGTRHFACWSCYLDAGKSLAKLNTASLRRIPWRIVRDRGLQGEVYGILAIREGTLDAYLAKHPIIQR